MRILGIILLTLLALLVLLLLLRVGGKVEYSEAGFTASVRAGPIYYQVYPRKPKRKKKRRKAKRSASSEPPDKPSKPPDKPSEPVRYAPAPEKSSEAAKADRPPAEQADQTAPPREQTGTDKPKAGSAQAAPAKSATETGSKVAQSRAPAKKKTAAKKGGGKGRKKRKRSPSSGTDTPRGGALQFVLDHIQELLDLAGQAVHRLRVDELTIQYTIAGRWDAAGAAMQYGSVYATGGVLYPILAQQLRVKRWQVGADIDFAEEIPRVYLCLNLSYQVWELLLLGILALKLYWKLRKKAS